MRKKIIISMIACFIILFSAVYLIFFNTFYIHPLKINSSGDNNAHINSYTNISSRLFRVEDRLYYNYYNDLFKYGTYEINEFTTKRIYWDGPSFSGSYLCLDNVLGDNLSTDANVKTNLGEYTVSDGEKTENIDPYVAYVIYGEPYYYTSDKSKLYRGDETNKTLDLIISNEIVGCDSFDTPVFSGGNIYSVYRNNLKSDVVEEYAFEYSIADRAVTNKLLIHKGGELSGGIKRYNCGVSVNGKVYGTASDVYNENPGYYYNDVYVGDFKSNTSKMILHTTGTVMLNSYNDKAFISVNDGKDRGIYSIGIDDTVTKIFSPDENISGFYIVDDEYLYFIGDDNNTLYRINQQGENLEKIFG